MRPARPAVLIGSTAAAALAASMLAAPPGALAATSSVAPAAATAAPAGLSGGNDLAPVPDAIAAGKALPLDRSQMSTERQQNRSLSSSQAAALAGDAAVGDTKTWLALDDINGLYPKEFTLRGLGDHIQVWVADDRAFPDGDCRNDLDLTAITDDQVASFVSEFDDNIYPKESEAFSTPEPLDGTGAPLPSILGLPDDYYEVSADQADDIAVMVDNVRDANYYDPSTPDGQTYIAGFFYGTFDAYTNRNIMTIDAYDWLHRTGANPPDDVDTPAYQDCTAALGLNRDLGSSNPRLYEGTFAHEYQHLLESYEDPDEETWVNEGLSDYAQTLVGYVDTRIPPADDEADGHIACFDGYLGESFGGPENSLTRWEDQGGPEILCDYGAAYSFMMYLESHYGEAFMSALHREDANGIAGLDAVLDQFGASASAMTTIRDWTTTMAVDGALDRGRLVRSDRPRWFLNSRQLRSSINWDTPQAYDTEGAPTNGADFVRLRTAGGTYLKAGQLRSLSFAGDRTFAPRPVEWTVDATPPDAVTADTTCGAVEPGTGAAALASGCGDSLDRAVVQSVDVPADGGALTFDALWDTEQDYDYAFVQVSTDGGATWTSLATQDTTEEHADELAPSTVAMLPGFSGESDGWQSESADLSAHAGQTVLVAFRYVTDSGVSEAGIWVRNVDVAGTPLATDSLEGWQSATEVRPVPVPGWTLRLLSYDGRGKVWMDQVRLRAGQATLSGRQLRQALGSTAGTVAATVMVDDPTESLTDYGRYALTVNGVLQPGG